MQETFPKPRPEWLLVVLALTAGCSESRIPVSLPFEAAYDGQAISCSSDGVALSDLRFFVSEVTVETTDGERLDVPFAPDESWQNRSVALIDLEEGDGACRDGTVESNATLNLLWPDADVRRLALTIGVPFADNHADPLAAAPPLDDSAMHWHWRSGYKFLRAGIDTGDDGYWLHLGSTGCEGTTGNITGCKQPNRVTFELDGFVAGRSAAVVHLDRLFAGIDLTDGTPADCVSGPMETSCEIVFANLGLRDTPPENWLTMESR